MTKKEKAATQCYISLRKSTSPTYLINNILYEDKTWLIELLQGFSFKREREKIRNKKGIKKGNSMASRKIYIFSFLKALINRL